MNKDNGSNNGTEVLPPATLMQWMLRVLQGAIIGAGAILPGISGGVLCVVFGIYQPMMALLAHPVRTFKTHAKLLLPVLVGWVIGFLTLARLVEWLFKASSNLAVWLFIGLIAGMLPALLKDAGKQGRPKSAWVSMTVSTSVILVVLMLLQYGTKIAIRPNIWWFLVCGLLWGLSLVAPGVSSSSLLIFLGLYEPMAAGIAGLSLTVIGPMLIGILLMTFASARGINHMFKKHYAAAYHAVVGFVIASTIVIIPLSYRSVVEALMCAACFAAGFAAAWLMDRAGKRTPAKPQGQSLQPAD